MSDGAATWYTGLDDELKGHVQNKGWDKLEPGAAAAAAVVAHREAEKRLGIPADQILRLPKDPADAAWAEVWQRLGAPKDAADYKFDTVKLASGAAAPEDVTKLVRDVAAKLHMPAAHAAEVAQAFVAHLDGAATRTAEQAAVTAGTEDAMLKQNWGANYDLNTFLAKKAVESLGLPPELFGAIQQHSGYAKAMDAFRMLGARMTEPDFLHNAGGGPSNPRVLSREQAIEQKATLMRDQAFGKKFVDGDADAAKRLRDLDQIIVGPAPR